MLKIGDIARIKYDETKPNKHFQSFMHKYIGSIVVIDNFNMLGKNPGSIEYDEDGYTIVGVRPMDLDDKNIKDICYYYWREYDFELVKSVEEKIWAEKMILTNKDFELC